MDIDFLIALFELVGTVAFASSGALSAIRKGMDLLGVNVLAVVTAAGGGVIRDIIIGRIPPAMFSNSIYTITAMLTANIIFAIMRTEYIKGSCEKFSEVYEKIMQAFDTAGLAVFTITGINAGISAGYDNETFLLIFLGTVTGVGGGVLRDIMANERPYIFVKNIYACAAVMGAAVFIPVFRSFGFLPAAVSSFAVTIMTRLLAIIFNWNLPHINTKNVKNRKGA